MTETKNNSSIMQLSFKNLPKMVQWEDYDVSWESDFIQSGMNLIYNMLKELTKDLYTKKYKMKNKNGENMDAVFEYMMIKHSDETVLNLDDEDYSMLKNLIPIGFMCKQQFGSLDDFYQQCEKCWGTDFKPKSLIFHMESIHLDDDNARVLYLQAPKIMTKCFGYEFDKNEIWEYFRNIGSDYRLYMRKKIREAMSESFVLMLLKENGENRIEVSRIINTLENSQKDCVYNTDWLFKKLGMDYCCMN